MIKVNNRKNNDVRGTCNSLTEVSEVSDLSTEGMLQAAVSKGIINIADVEETLRMKQREEILNNHPYSIWQGKNNGKWYTYIPDESKARKMAYVTGFLLMKMEEYTGREFQLVLRPNVVS